MKVRLPRLLLASLLAAMLAAPVGAAVMHSDVSRNTYIDFASNSGRFAVGATSAMLDYIRERDNGVKLSYTDTSSMTDYTLAHGMISFDAVSDIGSTTAIGYNYVVTVAHQQSAPMPTFTSNDWGIGETRSIKYRGIQEGSLFIHQINGDNRDYKINRLSKLITDVNPVTVYSGDITKNLVGELVYRVGGGDQAVWSTSGEQTKVNSGGLYTAGGIGKLEKVNDFAQSGDDFKQLVITTAENKSSGGATQSTPLPFGTQGSDSGSPYFVWDTESQSYQLLAAHIGYFNDTSKPAGAAPEWTAEVMESDNVRVNMSWTKGGLRFKGAEDDGDGNGVTDTFNVGGQAVSVTVRPALGYLADVDGTNLHDGKYNYATFKGVDIDNWGHTWKSLTALKDSDTWYGYDDTYLNATESAYFDNSGDDDKKDPVIASGVTYAKLYQTQNVVMEAAEDGKAYDVYVDADTDLGIGYLHFAANGHKEVQFNVQSEENHLLNSAGYVIDDEVQVNVTLRNADATYMREWRKVGEGTLNICGEGKNEIFLNVGGKGLTLLNQEKDYAAYNVLVNTGATVKIKDTDQIYRDLTFGNGGGTLDMNGNSMEWYLTKGEDRDGFTINALTEEAIISNSSANKAVLTFKEEKNQKFVGSFQDSATSALGIVYDGNGTWELNGIRTKLENKDSGLTVESGTVRLAGTLTVHGFGTYSASQETADFSTRADDWHYADATMNVTVEKDATFELASHARLIGNVTVQDGGTYIMREGVNHAEEYIEGGEKKESTGGDVAKYYGHKGDVILEDGAVMKVQYTAGTDTATTYADDVTGPGKLVIDLGTDAAAFNMTGTISGLKQLEVLDKSCLNLRNMQDVAKATVTGEGSLVLQNEDKELLKVETINKEESATFSNVSLSSTSPSEAKMTGANGQEGHVQSAQLTVLADTTLVLEHVVLADDVQLVLAGSGARVLTNQAELTLTATNTVGAEVGVASAITLKGCGITDQLRLEAGDKIYSMISNALVGAITVQGSSLLVDMTALGDLNGYDAVQLSFGQITSVLAMAAAAESENTRFGDLASMSVTALMADGKTWNGFYSPQDASSVYFAYLPEPSTTTLSLLALAALCARRRRKMA